jgi:hypothetical protein
MSASSTPTATTMRSLIPIARAMTIVGLGRVESRRPGDW